MGLPVVRFCFSFLIGSKRKVYHIIKKTTYDCMGVFSVCMCMGVCMMCVCMCGKHCRGSNFHLSVTKFGTKVGLVKLQTNFEAGRCGSHRDP